MPTTTLAITYITAVKTESPFISSAVSRENVEKVVKPPHIPTFKKSNNYRISTNIISYKIMISIYHISQKSLLNYFL